ncbi:MAG TPA: phosphoglycerate mutase family protein [Terriglobia bacterium]|nr:phosphoglycerate mutase family protein [Terriglobia bacterium]
MRKRSFLSIAVLFFLLVWCLPCLAQRTIVVVRHADKIDDSDDAVLSPTGETQAKRLGHVLKDVGITAIYTSQFKRTIQTATPLAHLLKIKPFTYEQTDIDGVVKEIRRKHAKEIVMVVGHRSTVPRILKQFGALEPVALGSSEYDSLFILTLPPNQSPTLLHLRF